MLVSDPARPPLRAPTCMSEARVPTGEPTPGSDMRLLATVGSDMATLPALLAQAPPTGAEAPSLCDTRDTDRATLWTSDESDVPLHAASEMDERPGDLIRFTMYESRHHFYLVSHSSSQSKYRVLKIDRVPPIAAQHKADHDEAAPHATPSATPHLAIPEPKPPSTPTRPKHSHKRDKSMSSVVLSIAGDEDDLHLRTGNAPSGTLSSEITELASSLVPERDAGATPPPDQHGKYLGLYDADIQHLRLTAEWKSYIGDPNDLSLMQDAPERTVPPISALGTSRSPRSSHRVPHVASSKDETESVTTEPKAKPDPVLDPSSDAAWTLNVTGYSTDYTPAQAEHLLERIQEESRPSGGLREVGRYFGIVGFVRFTSGYYMVLISKRSAVSLVGGHYIYHCDETQVIPVCHPSTLSSVLGRSKLKEQQEAQQLRSFRQVDLGKNFYFSHTYDITRTLQENMTGPRVSHRIHSASAWGYKEKFMWNYHLLVPAFSDCQHQHPDDPMASSLLAKRQWVIPLVHGFVDQAKLSVLGNAIYVSLIARRSRHFAGARFYKRGIDADGHVANDVETEQIVHKPTTSPFFAPPARYTVNESVPLRPSPHFTSYVMMRGSIPVYWTQDSTNMSPRPPIEISVVDPYFAPATRHFNELFHSYGTPVIVLNLVKGKERQPRESKLLQAYNECIQQLNQFLPANDGGRDRRIRYLAWDMSRASKSRTDNVIDFLERLSEDTIRSTRFFHSGPLPSSMQRTNGSPSHPILLQNGIVRLNCVDCLDRTNAAQFVLGKAAFAHQLHALGLLKYAHLSFDSDAVNMLTEMYHDLGDTIALQYGGSALAHTTDTYRKINHWSSHSRDMLEGIRRYYANSFADAEKQASIDLFLGQAPSEMTVPRHSDFGPTEACCIQHLAADEDVGAKAERLVHFVNTDKGFWEGYYRPTLFTEYVSTSDAAFNVIMLTK